MLTTATGQGMNVSMNDAYNLGWKLASVLRGQADAKLLYTYSDERQTVAQTLIDFDRKISRLFASKPKSKAEANDEDAIDPAEFQEYFSQQGRFMAGLATHYQPSMIMSSDATHQKLASGFVIGERFHSARVLRLADAKPVHLGHVMVADGRWRIVLFGSKTDPLAPSSAIMKTCAFLVETLIPEYTPADEDVDSIFDVRAVFQQPRKAINVSDLPEVLLPHKGTFRIQDYEKAFTDEPSYGFGFGDIFNARGIDRDLGCIVVARPDQYVSAVLPLGEESFVPLEEFFRGFMRPVRQMNGH